MTYPESGDDAGKIKKIKSNRDTEVLGGGASHAGPRDKLT
jgi:hypothetical protein